MDLYAFASALTPLTTTPITVPINFPTTLPAVEQVASDCHEVIASLYSVLNRLEEAEKQINAVRFCLATMSSSVSSSPNKAQLLYTGNQQER